MNKRKLQLRTDKKQEYLSSIQRGDNNRPNILLVFCDDMGYGDLSCYGAKSISTPNIDSIAHNGVRMTNFYAASPLCSPSRYSCLTGRYANRGYVSNVFFPTNGFRNRLLNNMFFKHGVRGLLPDEITVAEALGASGYATGMIGKWHLGDRKGQLPNDFGFDSFYGAKYSNDMDGYDIYEDDKVVIPAPVDQSQMTGDFTSKAIEFIQRNKDKPFFLYYASPFPHHPTSASAQFAGSSKGGSYGDCVQELDWSVGQILQELESNDISDNTLVIFTSDNGPWYEGCTGGNRGRKGNNFDGGQKVPFVASMHGVIPQGSTVEHSAMNIDLFATMLSLANVPLPQDRYIDGVDIMPQMCGNTTKSAHDELYFINKLRAVAVKDSDNYKYMARFATENSAFYPVKQGAFLFDENSDSAESYNVLGNNEQKAHELAAKLDAQNQDMKKNQRGWIS